MSKEQVLKFSENNKDLDIIETPKEYIPAKNLKTLIAEDKPINILSTKILPETKLIEAVNGREAVDFLYLKNQKLFL